MANFTLNDVRINLRNDTSAAWKAANPILMKGEMGVEINTGLFKFGNGVDEWLDLEYANESTAAIFSSVPDVNDWDYPVGTIGIDTDEEKAYVLIDNTENEAVWKQIITPEDIEELISDAMLKSVFATNAKVAQGYVDKAIMADSANEADALADEVNIELGGDVSGVAAFDGSKDITITTTLANILTAGTGCKITVNSKGLVTAITNLEASDIPDLTLAKITDAGTAAALDAGTDVGNAVVVESNGLINNSLIGSLYIVEVKEFDTIAEMLEWSEAEQGDMAIVNLTTGVEVYVLKRGVPNLLTNWVRLNIPTGAVVTVNGETGAVSLTTTNIPEGTNKYYTEARATANFETNFALNASSGLTDGATIIHSTDTLVLNGGSATIL